MLKFRKFIVQINFSIKLRNMFRCHTTIHHANVICKILESWGLKKFQRFRIFRIFMRKLFWFKSFRGKARIECLLVSVYWLNGAVDAIEWTKKIINIVQAKKYQYLVIFCYRNASIYWNEFFIHLNKIKDMARRGRISHHLHNQSHLIRISRWKGKWVQNRSRSMIK